jgi:signal peptidase I
MTSRLLALACLLVVTCSAETTRHRAVSLSMLPTLRVGQEYVCDWARDGFDKLTKGDIVVYRSQSGALICHRVFKRMGDAWWPRGDNNPLPDREYVTRENFRARVVEILPTAQPDAGFAKGRNHE